MADKSELADQNFLEFVVKSIVDYPDDVTIDRKVDEMGVLLTLKVNAKDMGQVVGREGNTAKAIRSLLRIVGIKHDSRINLKIEEPDGGRGPNPPAPAPEEAKAPNSGAMDKVIDDIKDVDVDIKE